jgi:hypothetical protein
MAVLELTHSLEIPPQTDIYPDWRKTGTWAEGQMAGHADDGERRFWWSSLGWRAAEGC